MKERHSHTQTRTEFLGQAAIFFPPHPHLIKTSQRLSFCLCRICAGLHNKTSKILLPMKFLTRCTFSYLPFILLKSGCSPRDLCLLWKGQPSFNLCVSLWQERYDRCVHYKPTVLFKAKKDTDSFSLKLPPLNQHWTRAVAAKNQRSCREKWNPVWIEQGSWSFPDKFILSPVLSLRVCVSMNSLQRNVNKYLWNSNAQNCMEF